MARLGELLVAARLLAPEQVEQALAAQVVWGARLGTNLVELKLLDLDGVTRALGRQHALPAALSRHFERSDPAIQQLLPPGLALKHFVVPLLRVAGDAIAIAAIDPIDEAAHGELAEVLGVAPDKLVVSIAAELRVRYHLERVYGIARSARFLRSKKVSATPFPRPDEFDVEPETDPNAEIPIAQATPTRPPSGPHAQAAADDLAELIDRAVDSVTTEVAPDDSPPGGIDRRRYVETLDVTSEAFDAKQTMPLGRIAIRRAPRGQSPSVAAVSAVEQDRPPETFDDARRAIRRGIHRDRVATLAIETIERFVPTCEAAMILVVRGAVAVGWKWFARTDHTPPELAVPMDQEGLAPTVVASNTTARCAADDLGAIDMLLLRALGRMDGDLVVIPIAIGNKVICVIAMVTTPEASVEDVEIIAGAAGTAFARLIRDASR